MKKRKHEPRHLASMLMFTDLPWPFSNRDRLAFHANSWNRKRESSRIDTFILPSFCPSMHFVLLPKSDPETVCTRELKTARTTGTRGTKGCQWCFHSNKKKKKERREKSVRAWQVRFPLPLPFATVVVPSFASLSLDTPVNASRV